MLWEDCFNVLLNKNYNNKKIHNPPTFLYYRQLAWGHHYVCIVTWHFLSLGTHAFDHWWARLVTIHPHTKGAHFARQCFGKVRCDSTKKINCIQNF